MRKVKTDVGVGGSVSLTVNVEILQLLVTPLHELFRNGHVAQELLLQALFGHLSCGFLLFGARLVMLFAVVAVTVARQVGKLLSILVMLGRWSSSVRLVG